MGPPIQDPNQTYRKIISLSKSSLSHLLSAVTCEIITGRVHFAGAIGIHVTELPSLLCRQFRRGRNSTL